MVAPLTCLVLDPQPAVRRGVGVLFESAPDIELVAVAATPAEALARLAEDPPRVCVADVAGAGDTHAGLVGRLRAAAPQTPVVVLSARGDRRLLTDALTAGAHGYVLKSSPLDDLVRAIRAVAGGRSWVDPELAFEVVLPVEAEGAGPLGEREREILQCLAEGLSTEQVANRLDVPAETVKAGIRRAVARLEASGRVHAVALALRRSLID